MLAYALALHDDQRMVIDRLQHRHQRRTSLDRDADGFDRRHGVGETAPDRRIAFRHDVVRDNGAARRFGRARRSP